MNAKALFGLTLAALLLTASAHAGQNSTLESMDLEADVLAADAQAEEIEGYSYDLYETQTKIEAKQVANEAKKLESKIARLERQKKASERKAQSAAARLEASEKRREQARKRLAQLEREKSQVDNKVERVTSKVATLNEQAKEARNRANAARQSMLDAERKHNQLLRRKKMLAQEIEKKERQRKQYNARRMKIQKKTQKTAGI